MEQRFVQLLEKAIHNKATDIHFQIDHSGSLTLALRTAEGLVPLKSQSDDIKLFNYLLYQAHLDITGGNQPQTGSFSYFYHGHYYDFRFAVIRTATMSSGVLRILNNHRPLTISSLSQQEHIQKEFRNWQQTDHGLVILSGPTGSGKTTTLYTILGEMSHKSVYTLEDPIEVYQSGLIQLEINEAIGLSYANGIRQILRHDPDVIMIGEIRDETAAAMAVRAALTGCLVFTTIHAFSLQGAVDRMCELNVSRHDLFATLLAVSNQRLLQTARRLVRQCVYDIADYDTIQNAERCGRPLPENIGSLVEKQRQHEDELD